MTDPSIDHGIDRLGLSLRDAALGISAVDAMTGDVTPGQQHPDRSAGERLAHVDWSDASRRFIPLAAA